MNIGGKENRNNENNGNLIRKENDNGSQGNDDGKDDKVDENQEENHEEKEDDNEERNAEGNGVKEENEENNDNKLSTSGYNKNHDKVEEIASDKDDESNRWAATQAEEVQPLILLFIVLFNALSFKLDMLLLFVIILFILISLIFISIDFDFPFFLFFFFSFFLFFFQLFSFFFFSHFFTVTFYFIFSAVLFLNISVPLTFLFQSLTFIFSCSSCSVSTEGTDKTTIAPFC